jgi:hypothetical protein
MFKISFSIFFILQSVHLFAQGGCTDTFAKNYDKNAKYNDGSCLYDESYQSFVFAGNLLPKVSESSGVVLSNGFLWTHNDSGNPNAFYKVDTSNGKVLQSIFITNFSNTDWEDIAADSQYIYIADCGNNDGIRKDLKILKVDKSLFLNDTSQIVNVTAEAINFNYVDQTSFISSSTHNFDCEAIVSVGDSIYLFSKNRGDFKSRIYPLTKNPGTYTIHPTGEFNVNGLITGADYIPEDNKVVLIGYQSSHKNSFLYYLDDFRADSFFTGNNRRVEISNSKQDWQTEGICFNGKDRLFLTCESTNIPAALYQSNLKNIHNVKIEEIQSPLFFIYPNPCHEILNILSNQMMLELKINAMDGQLLYAISINNTECFLDVKNLNIGNQMICVKVYTEFGLKVFKVMLQ